MAEYTMTKKVTGRKQGTNFYQFFKDGVLVDERHSNRDYVAATFWKGGGVTPHQRPGLVGTKTYSGQVMEGAAYLPTE